MIIILEDREKRKKVCSFSILHLLVAKTKTQQLKSLLYPWLCSTPRCANELKFDVLVSEKLKKFVLKCEAKNFIFVAARIAGMKPGLKLG